MITIKLNRLIETLLLMLLVIFPFSFERFTTKWDVLFVLILFSLVLMQLTKNYINIGRPTLTSIITIIFLLFYDSSEKVNFIRLFNIQSSIGWRIPLSTIVLSMALLVFMIKLFITKKFEFNFSTGIKYVLFSFILVFIFVVLFFPFLNFYYGMKMELDIQLINRMLKYIALIILIQSHVIEEVQIRRFNLGIIISISAVLILNIFF